MTLATVSTPGKLILMGEHAVVYGHPALVAAVDLRLRTRLSRGGTEGSVELRLPELGHVETLAWSELVAYARRARDRWGRYAEGSLEDFDRVRGDDPAHVPKVALGEALRHLGERSGPALRVETRSEIPIGSGFGSSAAVAVGVLAAYLALRGAEPDAELLERLALHVERRQHGFPSGVDSATVVRGGLVWAESGEEGSLTFSPLDRRPESLLGFRVFDTGTPVEATGTIVAAVRRRLAREQERLGRVLERMGEVTRSFRQTLLSASPDPARLVELIREYESGLEALGVVPGPCRELVRRIEAEGGGAKISGAGALTSPPGALPGAGSLLVYHPTPRRVEEWDFLEGLRPYGVELGAAGFRLEDG